MGFQKEILSDQGTQFNSDLMKQFHALCQCLGIRISPYHPRANGTVERFHDTLKAMLKKIVRNHPSAWHRYLPALLFACREVPLESTGFSPFHLLFGREVRGTLLLLKDTWTNKDQSDAEAKPLYPYLFELKNILAESSELAMQNSSAASQRNKKYYDKKTQDRKFSVGEEVLVSLPSASNKLLSSWLGPFPITKVFHPDYRVLVKGKEKVFHANMLKRYVRREKAADVAVGGVFSLSGILSPGVKFHRYWMKLTCLFPRFLLFPLGIFMLLNRSVRLESFKIIERMFQFLLFLSQCRRLFLMRMFRASGLMLLCRKFSWVNSRRFFKHMLIF